MKSIKSTVTLLEQTLHSKTLFFSTVATTSYAYVCIFLPEMNKSMHAMLIQICIGGGITFGASFVMLFYGFLFDEGILT